MTKRYNLGIGNLKNMVDLGRIRVPDFQRDYVWAKEDRIRLMDSILKGYPIGVLTLWNPDENIRKSSAFQTLPTLGPIRIPQKENPFLLLDGLQRLVTIYTCLYPYENSIDFQGYEDNEHRIWLDLEADEKEGVHRFTQYGGKLTQHEIFSFLSGMGDLTKKFQTLHGVQGAKKYVHKAKNISRTLSEFQIPVVEFYGDLDDAIEYFVRVNSTGVKMTASDLLKKIIKHEVNQGMSIPGLFFTQAFKSYDYEWIADAYLMAEKNILHNYEILMKPDSKISQEMLQDFVDLVHYSREVLKIIDSKLWPYRVQFGFIYCYVRHLRKIGRQLNINDDRWLITWFWKTSYTGFFEDYSRLKEHFEIFVENMDNPQVILDSIQLNTALPFPERMTEDLKTTRERTLALFMLPKKDVYDNLIFERFTLDALDYTNNPGNIFVNSWSNWEDVIDDEKLFDENFLDTNIVGLFKKSYDEDFIIERCLKIIEAEKGQLKKYDLVPHEKDFELKEKLEQYKEQIIENRFNFFVRLDSRFDEFLSLIKKELTQEDINQLIRYLYRMVDFIFQKRTDKTFELCESYFNLLEDKIKQASENQIFLFWTAKAWLYIHWFRSLNNRNDEFRQKVISIYNYALTLKHSIEDENIILKNLFSIYSELFCISHDELYLNNLHELCEKLILPIYWGHYHLLANNFEEAKKYLNQALLYPEFKNSASNQLIEAYSKSDQDSDTEEGILFAEDFLLRTVNPPATTLVYYAVMLIKKKRYDDAINILFDAQSLDLSLFPIYYNLAICYAQLDRQEESLRYLLQAFETAQKFETINNLPILKLLEEVQKNPNFEKYRETPYFKAIIQKFEPK